MANYSFEADSLAMILKQEHFGPAVIQLKGKTDDENNESTGKAIKGEKAITVATSDSLYSTELPTIGAIDYVNSHMALCWETVGGK